jgi:hypothetical protein
VISELAITRALELPSSPKNEHSPAKMTAIGYL